MPIQRTNHGRSACLKSENDWLEGGWRPGEAWELRTGAEGKGERASFQWSGHGSRIETGQSGAHGGRPQPPGLRATAFQTARRGSPSRTHFTG